MITALKSFSLILAAGFPAAFGAEAFGLSLPSFASTGTLLGVFVASLTLLTMLTDYRRLRPLRTYAPARANASVAPRSHLRLAA